MANSTFKYCPGQNRQWTYYNTILQTIYLILDNLHLLTTFLCNSVQTAIQSLQSPAQTCTIRHEQRHIHNEFHHKKKRKNFKTTDVNFTFLTKPYWFKTCTCTDCYLISVKSIVWFALHCFRQVFSCIDLFAFLMELCI